MFFRWNHDEWILTAFQWNFYKYIKESWCEAGNEVVLLFSVYFHRVLCGFCDCYSVWKFLVMRLDQNSFRHKTFVAQSDIWNQFKRMRWKIQKMNAENGSTGIQAKILKSSAQNWRKKTTFETFATRTECIIAVWN